jgi:hopanoid biosynthesis associated RND transporter like protein HpnN
MAASRIGRIVAASCRLPVTVLLVALLLAAAALLYTARHFAMTADTAELIATELTYRQHEIAYDAAFPQFEDVIVVVLDGVTPELADAAASRLVEGLRAQPALFRTARQPDGGDFFARNGLLLLPTARVQAVMEQLIRAQPFLGPLAADPSLRGVMGVIETALQGVQSGQAKLDDIAPAMAAIAETAETALAGRPAFFSWRNLIAGATAGSRETRRILLVQPVMDYTALQPGAAASAAIRETARRLGLGPAHGVTLRLTGPVPLADEEFGTLAQDAELVTGAMLAALLLVLWLAVRSVRCMVAILVTTLLGLIMTTGAGLLATGRFNLISVAFIPLFVGLGIDFAIQFCVRYLAERRLRPGLYAALVASGNGIGRALALAAAAICVGFFAFLPTSFIGVAELGAIAGLGMIIAFVLCITLLPALLTLLQPAAGRAEMGYAALAPVEAMLRRNRRVVLVVAALVGAASTALLPWVRFDFNPLNLRSEAVESMATLRALMVDPDRTPNTVSVLAPSLEQAPAMARRLRALPEVSHTVTLDSFIPDQQAEKLALIRDAAALLEPTLEGVERLPPPDDPAQIDSLRRTAASLRASAGQAQDPAAVTARCLADALDRLAAGPSAAREAVATALAEPLDTLLDQTHAMLQAGPVSRETLPPDLVADWLTADGRARVEAFPHADASDDASLQRFSTAIQAIAPDAAGTPISIKGAGDAIVAAFLQAAALSALAITLLLVLVLRRLRDVLLTMLPVLLSAVLTLASCVIFDLPLNFANIIALPLLLGIGVAFNIYFVMAWRAGEAHPLQSSLTRAVVFSALTTATAFGALWLSSHPGTASMGRLLMLSLGWELLVTLLVRPALLAVPPAEHQEVV